MLLAICNRAITYLFYILFFFVPLIFLPVNSELFEFNKMIFTYMVTALIGTFWATKMIVLRKSMFRRTPLDIPIFLFLAAQIISTLTSIEMHTSVWGYYSRSNGGLASILSYIFLYYALVSNLNNKIVKRMLMLSLLSGFFVALYGVLERFGIDKDFWVQDVQNRVFSTLGQPNWLAAYLSILIPLAIAFGINTKSQNGFAFGIWNLVLGILFYTTLLFTKSRSGFLGFWVGMVFFIGALFFFNNKARNHSSANTKYLLLLLTILTAITFLFGAPFEQLNKFTLVGIQRTTSQQQTSKPQGPALEVGGTESGTLRKIVWKGAIDIAKANPFFGTGVETFAYSYYKFRPVEHNKTSEWDFLYNKAHNEYLNYLANTGFIGLGTYLLMIGAFMVLSIRYLVSSMQKKIPNTLYFILTSALLSTYTTILVSNFFGFSVVVTNLYFFLIPAFFFTLTKSEETEFKPMVTPLGIKQWVSLSLILLTSYFLLLYFVHMWEADRNFALGESYNQQQDYSTAYKYLTTAIQNRPGEPLFSEEFSTTTAALSIIALEQKDATLSGQLIDETVRQSNYTVANSPNNPAFWRTRVHVLYTLSQVDPKYLEDTLTAAKTATQLAPTEPKIAYNYALILGQAGKNEEAIKELERAVALKPDYRDTVYALGLFYHEAATDKNGVVVNEDYLKKAIVQMENVLKLAPDDSEAKGKLKEWRGF